MMVNKKDFFVTYSYFEKDILVEIIDIFKTEAPEKIERLYTDLREANYDSLRFNAHSLKGTIGSFCAAEAWIMAKNLEADAALISEKNGQGMQVSQITSKIDKLKETVEIMISELNEIREELLRKG